jgi:hypothetical protein
MFSINLRTSFALTGKSRNRAKALGAVFFAASEVVRANPTQNDQQNGVTKSNHFMAHG